MNSYLIPSNTKKGSLILGIFRPVDLIIFGTGVMVTVILLATVTPSSLLKTIIVLAPALITGFLVVPIPYYHNMLNVISELIAFLTNRQRFYWKGWCVMDEKEDKASER